MTTEAHFQTSDTSGSNKHYGPEIHLQDSKSNPLDKVQTAQSIVMSPELFEKLYLSPQNAVKGDLRKTFGNPTPVALIGFALSLTPLSCDLMGWRGAGGNGAASTGVFFFLGGLLMIIGGIFECILGNTFPFVVFCAFGGFWLSFASTLVPFYNAYGAYSVTDNPTDGLNAQGFNASFGFFLLFFTLLCFIFLVCSLRTNVAFVIVFLTVFVSLACLVGVYFQNANGNSQSAKRLTVVAGAFSFVAGMTGWYIIAALLLAAVDFPVQIPVGDLSTKIKGASFYARNNRSKEQE